MAKRDAPHSRCLTCGFEAPPGGDEWEAIEMQPLGRLTQCPECESTDIQTGIEIR